MKTFEKYLSETMFGGDANTYALASKNKKQLKDFQDNPNTFTKDYSLLVKLEGNIYTIKPGIYFKKFNKPETIQKFVDAMYDVASTGKNGMTEEQFHQLCETMIEKHFGSAVTSSKTTKGFEDIYRLLTDDNKLHWGLSINPSAA